MKLFIAAALFTVCAAGRLEHLENAYLPPFQASGQFGAQPSTFGSSFGASGSLGGHGGSGSLGGHGFGSGGFDSNGINAQAGVRSPGSFGASAFPGATINQYLPPNHGPSASGSHFGSSQGFGNQGSQYPSQFGSASQYTPNSQFGASSSFGSRGSQLINSQFPAASRQYLTPKSSSYPQQAFDEETGYHY